MADEERAAKAARAKAMLKKRQQQKKSGVAPSSSGVNTPSPPVSRAVTPAPSHARDSVGIINVTGALEPPPSAHESSDVTGNSKPGPVDTSAARDVDVREKEQHDEEIPRMLQDKQQTISLLVSEKAALVEALKGFEGVHSSKLTNRIENPFIIARLFTELQSKEAELEGKLQEFHEQQVDFIRVKGERSAFSTQLQDLDQQNTHLASKLREQERELLSSRNETEKLRSELHEKERRTRELEEQIQNDDRVELLETKLKNTQDRAEEVSFQLSKLKQSHDKLKNDHKELQRDLGSKMTTGEELQKSIATLGDKLRSSEDELSDIASERDTLAAANDTLTSQLQANEQSVVELELKFSQAVSDLSAVTRQFETSQVELRTTLERAEDAEKAQHDLQEEGLGLMRSLDEMRPKISTRPERCYNRRSRKSARRHSECFIRCTPGPRLAGEGARETKVCFRDEHIRTAACVRRIADSTRRHIRQRS
ncbi:hypothetical protein DFH11DRAFT_20706 [Phellopilus nigrolimitatus]|nr:hypothetical protein DFH11DRAFT_20706 [Phellopilus nigrolimitatus]